MRNETGHVVDELSAYLDGEAEGAAQVESHLRGCPECARHYRELRAVTVQVRKLRAPEVQPEFVSRVLVRVQNEAEEPPAPWWLAWLRPAPMFALATVAAVFVGVIAYQALETPAPPASEVVATVATDVAPAFDSGAAPAALNDLRDNGVDLTQLADALGADEAAGVSLDGEVDEATASLIDSEFGAMLDAGWSNRGDDVFGTIEDMSPEEQLELQMLLESAAPGDDTNEG